MSRTITAAQARRIALSAQGFGSDRDRSVTMRQVQQVISQVAQFQIDSVNVCIRAHYMPLYARLGSYDRELLDRAVNARPRRVYEFWGHAASMIDVKLAPAFRFRGEEHRSRPWNMMREVLESKPELIQKVYDQVAERGPLTSRQIEHDQERTKGPWWDWSEAKSALEWLFYTGELSSAGRNAQFERRFDLPERVLPAVIHSTPTPREDEARIELARRAAAALGVFSEAGLAEYFYTDRRKTGTALAHLIATGEVEPVTVAGWSRPGHLWSAAARPRKVHTDALVAPFDSLVFDRERLLETFGVHYRIGLYTPKAQRVHGYYVYLFVMDDRIAARTDLKADRKRSRLLVQSAWLEPGSDETETARRLAAELHRFAEWLELADVAIAGIGDLADALGGAAVSARS